MRVFVLCRGPDGIRQVLAVPYTVAALRTDRRGASEAGKVPGARSDNKGELMFYHRLFDVSMAFRVRATVTLHAGLATLYHAAWRTWERDNHLIAMLDLHEVLMDLAPEVN
jgi:hypothetical protein